MLLFYGKGLFFSVYEKPSDKEKLFQHTKISISHCIKTNVQLQISSAKPYCELAVQQSFFEKHRSCVCTTATLSHRFKSSPAIPGKVAVPGVAGYLMNAGHFSESHVSSGDLNRRSQDEVPCAFYVTFCTMQKVTIRTPLPGVSRFYEPRISSPQWRLL